MNMWNLKSLKSLATVALTAAFALVGCAKNGGSTYEYDSKSSSYWSSGQKPAAAPAPAPATPTKAAPAPAPAPSGDGLNWVSAYFPTGDKASSGLWVQKGFPTEASVGEEFCYYIKVTNLTSATLTDVVVNDTVPAGFAVSSTDPAAESNEGGKLRWRFPSMKGAEVKTIKVCGKASAVGDVGGCATATYNNELCHKVKIVQPSLALVKTLTPAAIQCDPITMTIKVTNNGTGPAKNVKISDTLPDGLTTADGKNSYTADVGTLAAGQSKDFTVPLKATKTGTFDNTATATADGGLKAESKASTKVTKPVLTIAQTCPKVVFIGKDACNEITVKNTGDAEAKTASVAASIPAGATFVSATDGGVFASGSVTWNLGSLAAGAEKKLTVCYRPGNQGSFKVDAAAKAYCADAVTSNCVTEVKGIPAILLEVVDVNDPVEVGKNEIYTITATNQGSQAGKNVKIVVTLEDNAELVNTDGSATKGTAAGKVITFDALPTLAPAPGPGNKAVWKVVVKAVKEGDVRFKVTMTEDGLGRPVEETEATNFYK